MKEFKVFDVRCQKGDSAFLLDNGNVSILFDTGFGFTGLAIAENVRAILGERELDYIFLSHSHYDHVLGCGHVLRFYPKAKIVAGRYVADIFRRDGAKRVMKELDAKFAATCGVSEYELLLDELRVDIPCDDGDVLTIDDMTFEVVNLPGHTRCSVGYFCREQKLLLSSETLGVFNGIDMIVPTYLVSYLDTLNSIERARKLEVMQLLCPHFGLLDKEQTVFFLNTMKTAAEKSAQDILLQLKAGASDEEIIENYKHEYWKGYIKEAYPVDALNLNTSIMIHVIRKELL